MTDINSKDRIIMPHNLILKDRRELNLSGVTDVDSFDETSIVAYTDYGELTINGNELHIGSLNTETGELTVSGEISSLIYLDNRPKSTGFFSRVFR